MINHRGNNEGFYIFLPNPSNKLKFQILRIFEGKVKKSQNFKKIKILSTLETLQIIINNIEKENKFSILLICQDGDLFL